MKHIAETIEVFLGLLSVILLVCAIGAWSMLFVDFDGSERPTCKAGSVAALFTDCEVIQ